MRKGSVLHPARAPVGPTSSDTMGPGGVRTDTRRYGLHGQTRRGFGVGLQEVGHRVQGVIFIFFFPLVGPKFCGGDGTGPLRLRAGAGHMQESRNQRADTHHWGR